jgi:nucleotide-binding universal stress UspA family protein
MAVKVAPPQRAVLKRTMASAVRYLVPIDFSKSSVAALRQAILMAQDSNAELHLVHVVPLTLVFPAERRYFEILENRAAGQIKRLAGRMKLRPNQYRSTILRRGDVARAITDLARKFRVSMIIMGSRGRTGLERFMLGSVAERTLRYARCPVLVVKG